MQSKEFQKTQEYRVIAEEEFASSTCKMGEEEELLDRMPELARRLTEIP
jgi:hypothetical protein